MTHEILTPNLFATSFALTSWRIGRDSTPTAGKRLPMSLPFRYCMPPSLVLTARPNFIYGKQRAHVKDLALALAVRAENLGGSVFLIYELGGDSAPDP